MAPPPGPLLRRLLGFRPNTRRRGRRALPVVVRSANILIVIERRRRITESVTASFLQYLSLLRIRLDPVPDEGSVLRLSRTHRLSVYDAAYLELAQREGLPLATLDADLPKGSGQRTGNTCFQGRQGARGLPTRSATGQVIVTKASRRQRRNLSPTGLSRTPPMHSAAWWAHFSGMAAERKVWRCSTRLPFPAPDSASNVAQPPRTMSVHFATRLPLLPR